MIHPDDVMILADVIHAVAARRAWSATLQNLCVTCGHTKAWHSLDGPWCDVDGPCQCGRYVALGPEAPYPWV